jgi:D-3-phosphoglycerate dehydrogenase / 2-oxoglutarate reductase
VRILLASPIHQDAEAALRQRHDVVLRLGAAEDELANAATDRQAIIFRSGVTIGPGALAAPGLRLLVRAGSGLDNLDLATVRSRGIELRRIAGPGAQAVAELTFAHMLALARQLTIADRSLREGHWVKSEIRGLNLTGKTLGVIGLGSIGTRVAELGMAWGMRAIGSVEHGGGQRQADYAKKGIELMPDSGPVLEQGDFVTIHVPLGPTTRGLIGADEIRRMKPTAFLVNMARGGVVDEAALLEALRDGRLAGAGLDVHVREGEGLVSPLAELPNVVLTPHIGAMTLDAQREIGQQVVEIVDTFSRDQGL